MSWGCESLTTVDLFINVSDFKVIIDFLNYDLTCHLSFSLEIISEVLSISGSCRY